MPTTTLSTKGQVVLPSEVRERLALEAGARFEVTVEADRVVLVPIRKPSFKRTTLDDIKALAAKYPPVPTLTDEEIEQRMRQRTTAKWRSRDGAGNEK